MSDFRKLIRFRDQYGNEHRLTDTQWHYLYAIGRGLLVTRGDGGLSSTVTVQTLHQLGLLNWHRNRPDTPGPRWKIIGLTALGQAVYAASTRDSFPRDGIIESPSLDN